MRSDAPSTRLVATRAWEGPVGSRGQAGLLGRARASRSTLLEPIALGVHLQDVDMVGDAVEQGAGEPLACVVMDRCFIDGRAILVPTQPDIDCWIVLASDFAQKLVHHVLARIDGRSWR